MAVRHGYGKIAGADALVFAYDTGDTRNSFKGKPITNKLKNLSQNYAPQDTATFKVSYGTDTVNIPKLGTTAVTYCDIYNDYNGGSEVCCPSPFGYGTDIAVSPSTAYTYQIIFKTTTGYANSNYMYRYEYSTSGYVTEAGAWNSTRQEDLGDGWIHAWGTFTTNAATNSHINGYLFHYEYATQNRIQIAGVMLTEGTSIIPPNQFIGFEQTRSATQGLLDLIGNSTIDISPTSFNSNAEIEYDGSNDYIYVGSKTWSFPNGATVEQIIKPLTLNLQQGFFTLNGPGSYINFWMPSNNTMRWEVIGTTSQGYSTINCTTVFQTGQYYHVVGTFNGTTTNIYINGIEENGQTMTNQPTSMTAQMDIGRYGASYPSSAQIPVTKFYTRPLTAAEIKNNFNLYKSRYGM